MQKATFWLVVALAACGDSTSPAALQGTYALQTIDGKTPPVGTTNSSGTSEYFVTNASISFSGENSLTLTIHARLHELPPNEQWTDIAPRVITMTYTRSGNELVVATSSEVVPSEGTGITVSADAVILTLRYPLESTFFYDGNHTWIFRRN